MTDHEPLSDARSALFAAEQFHGNCAVPCAPGCGLIKDLAHHLRELIDPPDSDPHTETLWTGALGDLVAQLDYGDIGPLLEAVRSRVPEARAEIRVVRADTPHHKEPT